LVLAAAVSQARGFQEEKNGSRLAELPIDRQDCGSVACGALSLGSIGKFEIA
jgi:hypothetical protein